MLRPPLLLATFGLACSFVLWTVPAFVAAAAVPHALFPNSAPSLSQVIALAERTSGPTPNLLDALTRLIGAESEAMQVAAAGLQQPTPPDLGPRADQASARVLDAVHTYVRSAQAIVDKTRRN
jgi:hypothetical protein